MSQVRKNNLLSLLAVHEDQLPGLSLQPGISPPCSPAPHAPVAEVFQPLGHPKQTLIDGELWPPIFQPEAVRSAKRLVAQASDVFVCTYPKCGTTWIQHICSQLLHSEYGPQQGKELCVTSPMIERMGAAFCDALQHPRLLKTHFSHTNCPKGAKAKYIFAARNPKDCCVSYFHHNRNFKIYDWADGQFDVFFELFMGGRLAFGDYFEHLFGWLPHLGDENVLFLKYEDMLADLEGTVRKIGTFLGGRAAELVGQPESLQRIVAESSIDAMRQNQTRWFPGSALHKQSFIRKGHARDWKNYMSREQSERMDRLFRQRLAGTAAEGWWRDEMRWADQPDPVPAVSRLTPAQKEEDADSGLESDSESREDGEEYSQRPASTRTPVDI